MVYVTFRFQYKFSFGAVAALIHDVIITLGMFSIFQWDFDLTVLAALLAVIGYSLNDTIVVSDRIRENFRIIRKMQPIDIINHSLTQTLGRTLITSATTLLVLFFAFYFWWRNNSWVCNCTYHRCCYWHILINICCCKYSFKFKLD